MSVLDFAATMACGLILMFFAAVSFADAVKDQDQKRRAQRVRTRT